MGIHVGGHVQGAVPQDLLDHFEVDSHFAQERRGAMPQIVNMRRGQSRPLQEPVKSLADVGWPEVGSLPGTKDQIMLLPRRASFQARFPLLRPVSAEHLTDGLGQQDELLAADGLGITHDKVIPFILR